MNTCADDACAVALALKASRPDKDEQRRLGGGEVELVRNCVQYYQASNLDGKPHEVLAWFANCLLRIRCNLERQFVDPDATLLPSTWPAATERAAPDLDVLVWELEDAAKFLSETKEFHAAHWHWLGSLFGESLAVLKLEQSRQLI
ncbi:unnamed protein product [Effrenium voratum]|nr:unnamed protein product [Effrenium voratum]